MSFWKLERVPEPEIMDDPDEAASYASSAAARHLDAIDDSFVDHLARLMPASASIGNGGPILGLDIGSGPAQIPIKLLRRYSNLTITAIDRSPAMFACAVKNTQDAGLRDRLTLVHGDAQQLPFAERTFSIVMCNSVLHHASAPTQLLREIFRVATPNAAILLRDLRRPARPFLKWHLWRHGRHYGGLMRTLFDASVRAAYTPEEVENFLKEALNGNTRENAAKVFRFKGAHLGVEREGRF